MPGVQECTQTTPLKVERCIMNGLKYLFKSVIYIIRLTLHCLHE